MIQDMIDRGQTFLERAEIVKGLVSFLAEYAEQTVMQEPCERIATLLERVMNPELGH